MNPYPNNLAGTRLAETNMPPVDCQVLTLTGGPVPDVRVLLSYQGVAFEAYTSSAGVVESWCRRDYTQDQSAASDAGGRVPGRCPRLSSPIGCATLPLPAKSMSNSSKPQKKRRNRPPALKLSKVHPPTRMNQARILPSIMKVPKKKKQHKS